MNMQKIIPTRRRLVLCVVATAISCSSIQVVTTSFVLNPSSSVSVRYSSSGSHFGVSSITGEEDDQQSPSTAKKNQEKIMEMASIAGAEEIAKLDIQERTKRAMIAEKVEDRIFELVDELEQMVERNNGVLEGDDKEEAVELAKQTKALQEQYDDLVNGRPSLLLELGK